MKYLLKPFAVLLLGVLMFSSCSKEDSITVTDTNTKIDPTNENVNENYLTIRNGTIGVDSASVTAMQDPSKLISNYTVMIMSKGSRFPGEFFSMDWAPESPESKPVSGTYYGIHAGSVNQADLDAWEEWIENGADTSNVPQFTGGQYDASDVEISITNIEYEVDSKIIDWPDPNNPGHLIKIKVVIDKADVEIDGKLQDINSNKKVPVKGEFKAFFSRVE